MPKQTPKQLVLKVFPRACMGARNRPNGPYAVMQSAISWGPPVGADGKTPREAWAKAAENLPNWRAYGLRVKRPNARGEAPPEAVASSALLEGNRET